MTDTGRSKGSLEASTLRVALVAPEFPPAIGGMETYAMETARELTRRGVEVTVFTKPGRVAAEPPDAGLVARQVEGRLVHDRTWVKAQAESFDLWHLLNSAYAWIALEVAAPVVVTVYGNDLLNPNPVAGFDLKQRLGLPFGSRLDLSLARWRTPRLMRKGLHAVGHVIAISRPIEDLLLQRFPACYGRTSVGSVGVGAGFFNQPRVESPGCPHRFLTVARLSERRKNIALVLRALARLKDRFLFSYRIAGDGVERQALQRLAADLGLEDRVEFLGFVPAAELPVLYASSDLFVMPSTAEAKSVEGFGIVYLEANAAGTPVLAARQGGASDAVEPGVTGFLVDEPTLEAVVGALQQYLSGEVSFSPQACRDFAARFSWRQVIDHTMAVYSDVRNARVDSAAG
jgi:glycosyltransferase involved in cell wall biosynthesis